MNETLLIGCGNLGFSITEVFLRRKKKISIIEKNKKSLNLLKKKKSKLVTVHNSLKEINFAKYKYIILCVKPLDLEKLSKQLNQFTQNNNVIVSCVAGVTTLSLKKIFNSKLSIVRIMPNLSIKYGQSVTAVYSTNFSEKQKKSLKEFFSFFGSFIWLKKEEEIDFFTAFFGGGPAYVCYFLRCLQKILIRQKINKKISTSLIFNLLNGTINYLEKEKIGFNELISKVASKGGTTEEALKYFSHNQRLESVFVTAINKAEKRSKEISKSYN